MLRPMPMPDPARSKVLYLVHRVPYPPDKGDRIRNYHILAWLARRASVHLACLADEAGDDAGVGALEGLAERVAVVRIRRGSRWLQAARSLALGRTASEGAFQSREMCRLLRRWAGGTRYDAVLASASSLAPYLRLEEFRGVPAVVDFVDLDSQKWLDYAGSTRAPRSWLYATEGRRLGRLERDATAWARAVIFISRAEANLFRHGCEAANVHIVTNGVDMATFRPAAEVVGSDQTCVFVGALDYRPNVDGVCWFVREVWPEIRRRRAAARLLLVGRQPCPAVRRLAEAPGVEVVGQVPDVRPHVAEAAVVVVPLRLARGVQNKVLEALAMGKATVASPQSLAGLAAHGAVPVLEASTACEWVEAVVGLMDDPDRRRRLGREGRGYIEAFHGWDRCLEPLGSILGLSHQPDRAATDPCTRGPNR